ncbi:MAG: MerC family mercury resistance protein [Candidatus Rokubacteria bacterium]|nr:MerC family mercury resistance protein [Candidatus Rokubacteria bacterium]
MLGTVGRLGALASTVGSTVVCLGCCASVLGPVAAVVFAGGWVEWVPVAWQLPLLYGSLVVALVGFGLGWRRHRRVAPLGLFLPGAAAILYPLHEALDVWVLQVLIWLGFGLLLAAAASDTWLALRTPGCRPAAPGAVVFR